MDPEEHGFEPVIIPDRERSPLAGRGLENRVGQPEANASGEVLPVLRSTTAEAGRAGDSARSAGVGSSFDPPKEKGHSEKSECP